ncbi:hypothetical protein HYC85_018037 [Camellia sinensis]|uniref:Uncharacterized protein n=1 Tax=Camellia sinensis TaxID=4442 RepID=A0A7J7GTF1_CAMSI|nr:hypothetical protein HYC85_018037 [Camellia sinensis]
MECLRCWSSDQSGQWRNSNSLLCALPLCNQNVYEKLVEQFKVSISFLTFVYKHL